MSRSQRNRRRRRGRGRPLNKALLGLMVVAVAAVLGGLSAVGYVVSVAQSAPPLTSLKPRDPGSVSIVFAADGKTRLGVIQANELRKPLPGWQIPKVLEDATVAIEDERFWKHKGIDYPGIVRAAIKNARSGKTVQGGSTITMQLVRNLYITRERTWQRKVREAKLAEELENEHPGPKGKAWILNQYINTVPYGSYGGQTAVGAWAAAKMYFNKEPKDLTVGEAALLAGLPQAPSDYSPVRSPASAERRRNEVLLKMAELGMITREKARDEIAKPIKLDLEGAGYFQKRRENYFFDYIRDELYKAYPPRTVALGGLRIRTTIDLKKQKAARDAIQGRLAGVGPSSAIVTIDPDTGNILAMASSADYGKSKFNLAAQGHRQPGSTFKIMTLMAALRKGVDPERTTYVSRPLKFNDPKYGQIETKTYGSTYGGSMNLVRATLSSDNTVYMQLALDIGPEEVKRTAYDMGIRTKLDGYPAESLGGLRLGVSPLEMASAFATIANGGTRFRPTAIKEIRLPSGKVETPRRFRIKGKKVFEDWMTAAATDILVKNIQSGTGKAAAIGCPAGGKTGTTDEHNDAWFVGFTPRLSTAVWVGYPNAQIQMKTEYHGGPVAGSTYPSEIWGDYMKKAKGSFCGDFPKPKTPPRWSPFFGKYSRTGTRSDRDYSDGSRPNYNYGPGSAAPGASPNDGTSAAPEAGGGGTGNGGAGGQGFDPDLYESPPQPAPDGSGTGTSGGAPSPDG